MRVRRTEPIILVQVSVDFNIKKTAVDSKILERGRDHVRIYHYLINDSFLLFNHSRKKQLEM